MSAPIHADVASAIGQQVEQMILQAQKDSEARVRHDLSVARQQLQQMEGLIVDLGERVGRSFRSTGGAGALDTSQTVDGTFLNQKIAQLETKWGSEVKALKQDLHRTILAHNHNSDLMRHHRDALDEARRKLDAQAQPKAEQVDAQIEKVDRMLRAGQAKQRALDALTERLTALEAQVGDILPSGAMPGAYPGMMPGMPGMPGLMGQPPGMEREVGVSKRGAKKDEPPTDEEVRERLLQATGKAVQAETSFKFAAEAPVFVPRGAASAEAAGASAPKLTAGLPAMIQSGADADEVEDTPAADAAGEGEGDDADEAGEEAGEQAPAS